jgi:thiamine-monophosphate kinase
VRVSEIGEDALIAAFAEIYRSRAGVLVGIGDDGAVVSSNSPLQVVSTDIATEGIHFNRAWSSATDIGAKIAIANLADIYAMGGTPKFLTVAISAPADEDVSYLLNLARGIESVAAEFEVSVVGGDLVGGSSLAISITAFGAVERPVLRSNAKVGDKVFLTGSVGKSLAGLLLLSKGLATPTSPDVRVFQRPEFTPQILFEFGLEKVNALMDVSDGLLSDLPKIAKASGVGINLTFSESELSYLMPLSERVGISPLELFLRSGEEHSFIAVVSAERHREVPKQWIMLGEVVVGSEITYHGKGMSLHGKSWHW